MKNVIRLPLVTTLFSLLCLTGCGNGNSKGDEVVTLPDVFKDTNFCIVAGNWNESGAALIFDHNLKPEIQNGSAHDEFYDIDFEAKPLKKKAGEGDVLYFLPFLVKDQIIDDGYFKNGIEYKFWLSHGNDGFYCGLSKNDDTLKEPELVLTEGLM